MTKIITELRRYIAALEKQGMEISKANIEHLSQLELVEKQCQENGHHSAEKTLEIDRLKEELHRHAGVEGGVSAECGHPVQCLYAAAEVDGGPVACSMCDQEKKIKKLRTLYRKAYYRKEDLTTCEIKELAE